MGGGGVGLTPTPQAWDGYFAKLTLKESVGIMSFLFSILGRIFMNIR
jgi:hypothetical protein